MEVERREGTAAGPPQAAPLANLVDWLEAEVRQAKVQLVKAQQQMEQLQSQIWGLTEGFHKAEETLASLAHQVGSMDRLQEELRGVRDLASRTQERQVEQQGLLEELSRQRQQDLERARQEHADAMHGLSAVDKEVQGLAGSLHRLEEELHRVRDGLPRLEMRTEELRKEMQANEGRYERTLEVAKRLEQGIGRVSGEVEALHKKDDVLSERLQLYIDQLKKVVERVDAALAVKETYEELLQKVELLRLDVQRSQEQERLLHGMIDEYRQRVDDHSHALGVADSRGQALGERLTEMQSLVHHHHRQVIDQLQKLTQVGEKQKRRLIQALEQDLREMKQYEVKLGED